MENPLLRKAALPSEMPNRYESLGLRDNPFPCDPALAIGGGDPRRNGSIYTKELHEDRQLEFDRLLVPAPGRPEPRCLGFLMDLATRRGRGIGKTAFLKQQRDRLMADLGGEASMDTAVMFASHILPTTSPPCRKFWEFCRTVTGALCEDIVPQAVWRLRALSGQIPDPVLQDIGSADDWERTIGSDAWLQERGVDAMFGLNRAVESTIRKAGVRDELAHELAQDGGTPGRASRIFDWTSYHWRNDGGRALFHDLANFFMAAQFTRGLLLIDEVEKISYHQNIQERRAFAESLRYYMFDGDCTNAQRRFFGMLLTIHPLVQEVLLPHWNAAGLGRLAPLGGPQARQCTIHFGPLNRSMAIPLVTVYLDYFRLSGSQRGSIEPFTEDAVVEALARSQGVPGPALNLLFRVVERAAEEGLAEIRKDLVESVYAQREPMEAQEADENGPLPRAQVDLTGEGANY